ncbi:hypothetical protein [Allonocardiopsis opalescens]|uniref:Uncharacterized protein n=1 Tax=Allonocardiopsis opalescens TaxID=1144618 RepID=A0A2T0QAE0_9ACTN|nr:hypothetical protein [Allonocardiopsis opalescens]PRY00803.1 hypothetical protein CLV72_102435 [Allonocardiopsis opalescens]
MGTYGWDAVPDRLVITRAGIEQAVWAEFHRHGLPPPRCDAGIPEASAHPPGTELEHRCYLPATGAEPDQRTVMITITVQHGGPLLRSVPQP